MMPPNSPGYFLLSLFSRQISSLLPTVLSPANMIYFSKHSASCSWFQIKPSCSAKTCAELWVWVLLDCLRLVMAFQRVIPALHPSRPLLSTLKAQVMLHCDKKGQCSNNNAVSGKWRRARSKWGRDLRLQTLEFNTLYDVIHNDMNIHACCVLCIDYYRCILFDFLILDPFGMSWCEIFTNTSTCQGPAFCEATWNIAAAKPVMERVIASVDLAPSINPSILFCFLTATAFLGVQTAWRSLTFISGSNTKIIHQPQLQRKTTKAKERRMAPSNYSRQNLSVMNLTEMHIFCWAGAAYSGNRMGKDGKILQNSAPLGSANEPWNLDLHMEGYGGYFLCGCINVCSVFCHLDITRITEKARKRSLFHPTSLHSGHPALVGNQPEDLHWMTASTKDQLYSIQTI